MSRCVSAVLFAALTHFTKGERMDDGALEKLRQRTDLIMEVIFERRAALRAGAVLTASQDEISADVLAAPNCPLAGQPCSTMNSELNECMYSGSLSSGWTPQVCMYTYADPANSLYNGTCQTPPSSYRSDQVFGSSCNYNLTLQCSSYEPWQVPNSIGSYRWNSAMSIGCHPDAASLTGQSCRYNAGGSPGDPCGSNADCVSTATCNTARGWCETTGSSCRYSSSACTAATFCNTTSQMCQPRVPAGGKCAWYYNQVGYNNPCASGYICYQAGSVLGAAYAGTCVALNSLPVGARFTVGQNRMSDAAIDGMQLCSTGYAVAVPDGNGFPSTQGECVGMWSWTGATGLCPSCAMDSNGFFPMDVTGNLFCAPLDDAGSQCSWMPVIPYTIDYPAAHVAYSTCAANAPAVVPSGVQCSSFSSSGSFRTDEGTCAYYACYGAYGTYILASQYNPYYLASWFGEQDHCFMTQFDAAIEYAGSGMLGCSLPSSFASRGWSCIGTPAPPADGPARTAGAAVMPPGSIAGAVLGSLAGVAMLAGAAWYVTTHGGISALWRTAGVERMPLMNNV